MFLCMVLLVLNVAHTVDIDDLDVGICLNVFDVGNCVLLLSFMVTKQSSFVSNVQ